MSINIGSSTIGSLYLGSTKIGEAYLGNVKVYGTSQPVLPAYTIRCKFISGYTPTMGDSQTLVDASANIWDIYKNDTNWNSLFMSRTQLVEVIAANITGVTSMNSVFYGCSTLVSMPLFDTSSVTNMSTMFSGCTRLKSVPLFDTSSVRNMAYMFNSCSNLTSVPLFNTSSVTNMSNMFQNCYAVESGALALYQQASTQASPPTSHSNAFTNCGRDTVTGAIELNQIPTDWGGTYAPPSYNIEILYSLTDYGGAPSSTSITSSVITQDNTIMYKTASGNWVALTSEQKSSLINGYLYDVDIRGLRIQNVSPWGAFSCEISDDFESTDYSGSVTVTDSNGTQIVSSSSATFGTNLICQISNQFGVSWSGGEPHGMEAEIED